jgi:hypothetical protein
MKPVAIAALAFVAAFAGVFGFQYLPAMPKAGVGPAYVPPPKAADSVSCEDRATVETVKQLATKKLRNHTSAEYLLKNMMYDYEARNAILDAGIYGNIEFALSAFRERGKIGAGLTCAAIVTVRAKGRAETGEMATEYSVEPTTDGKVMVTARFMPN